MKPEVQQILSRYVSNMDKDVYTIMNLPEEVIAVIFAYVSRSPKGFRENLAHLVLDKDIAVDELAVSAMVLGTAIDRATEEAKKFHEKWVVGYGHSSVAEHGVVHLGVERISRLASAALELSNPFLSFTEYSQRYQRPVRDRFVVPEELEGKPVQRERFQLTQNLTFDAYERLEEGLFAHLAHFNPPRPQEDDGRYRGRIGRMGFEDARYVLTLAVETNLGMTANGRALRDALVTLLGDPHGEVRRLAQALEREALHVLPTLVRHVSARPARAPFGEEETSGPDSPAVTLVDYTGRGDPEPERTALKRLLEAATMNHGRVSPEGDLLRVYQEAFRVEGPFDPLPEEADHVNYTFRLLISEANWHQFLRHIRRAAFAATPPTIQYGIVVPPNVRDAGLEPLFRATIGAAETTYREVQALSPMAAHYMVTNAHRRLVTASLSLKEMAHLLRVRGAGNAQWDIRDTVAAMAASVEKVHPHLLAPMKDKK